MFTCDKRADPSMLHIPPCSSSLWLRQHSPRLLPPPLSPEGAVSSPLPFQMPFGHQPSVSFAIVLFSSLPQEQHCGGQPAAERASASSAVGKMRFSRHMAGTSPKAACGTTGRLGTTCRRKVRQLQALYCKPSTHVLTALGFLCSYWAFTEISEEMWSPQ